VKALLPREQKGVPLWQELVPSTVVKVTERYLRHCAILLHHCIDPQVLHLQEEKPLGI
jgi:hypothetical protein